MKISSEKSNQPLVNRQIGRAETAENDFVQLPQRRMGADGLKGDFGGRFFRIAINAGADARKSQGFEAVLRGQIKAVRVAAAQLLRLARMAAMPDRPHGVNDVAAWQAVSAGDAGLPRGAAAQLAALLQQFRPGGAVNGPIHPAAAQQRRIGGIHNGIHGQRGDIGLNGT